MYKHTIIMYNADYVCVDYALNGMGHWFLSFLVFFFSYAVDERRKGLESEFLSFNPYGLSGRQSRIQPSVQYFTTI